MKYKLRIKNYKLRVKLLLLSAFCLLLFTLNAQIEKQELKLTPEIEEMVVAKIKNLPEEYYSNWGIKDRSQLENLQLGKPIPRYVLVAEKVESVYTSDASRMSDGEPLSLEFTDAWIVPVTSDEVPLLFGVINFSNFERDPFIDFIKNENIIEHFHNYEHKDSIIGSIFVTPSGQMDHLIIRKENHDIFVEIYDEVTGEYFKNEYRLNELIPHLKELHLRKMEAIRRYYAQVADKSELILTPEITDMIVNRAYSSHINDSDWSLSNWGIKDRSQLEHLELGKPIPQYIIVNENLTFRGFWDVPVMSNGEPLFLAFVRLEEDGQYRYVGDGAATMAELIHNYEYKDLIVGFLGLRNDMDYLMIRRENQDIFVDTYDFATREYLKYEYTLSEIMNMIKK
jgi:hypothetical protein